MFPREREYQRRNGGIRQRPIPKALRGLLPAGVAIRSEPHHDLVARAGIELVLKAVALAFLVGPGVPDFSSPEFAALVLGDEGKGVGWAVDVSRALCLL
jgi:hypothetical protein